jgi:hypothetical protein
MFAHGEKTPDQKTKPDHNSGAPGDYSLVDLSLPGVIHNLVAVREVDRQRSNAKSPEEEDGQGYEKIF